MCGENVENEFHFLFNCKSLAECRLKTYHKHPEILNHANDHCKFNFLCKKPYVLGSTIKHLWHERMYKINEIVCNNSPLRVGTIAVLHT